MTADTMPQIYSWTDGRLVASDRPFWSDDDNEDEDFAGALGRNGFEKKPLLKLGEDGDPLEIEIYARPDGHLTTPSYWAIISIQWEDSFAWVDDPPSLLDLLTHLAPTAAAMAALADRHDRFAEESRQRKAEDSERALWRGR